MFSIEVQLTSISIGQLQDDVLAIAQWPGHHPGDIFISALNEHWSQPHSVHVLYGSSRDVFGKPLTDTFDSMACKSDHNLLKASYVLTHLLV